MQGINTEDMGTKVISPGLVDGNVMENGAWEGLRDISKAAIAGGVTFVITEPSLYKQEHGVQEPLYCDVGKMALIGRSSLDEVVNEVNQGAFALKAYLFPPSAYVTGVAQQFKEVLSLASQQPVPFILDVSYPSPRMLYMASPCRLVTLEERSKLDHFSEDRFFAGAFPEEIDPYSASISSGSSSNSSESEEEEDEISAQLTGFDVKVSSMSGYTSPNDRITKPSFPRTVTTLNSESEEHKIRHVKSFLQKTKSNLPSSSSPKRVPTVYNIQEIRRKSFMCRTIYEALKQRIEANKGNIENLSTVELMAYDEAGATEFLSASSRKRSNSITDKSPKLDVLKQPLFAPKISDFSLPVKPTERFERPTGLTISKSQEEAEPVNHDRHYIYHIANLPDHWETNGIEFLRKQLMEGRNVHVHICNLSSAASFSKLSRSKGDTTITTETSPLYLYFSMEDVGEGDTRMKVLPPIRNKANCNFLWDLLKMGQIDMIQSHHSFIPLEYKYPASGSFKKALNGLPGLGFSLQAVWTFLRKANPDSQSLPHYIVRMSKWLALMPAKTLGVADKRGSLEPGKYADMVVWDPDAAAIGRSVSPEPTMCPYNGVELYGKVCKVYVRGQVAYSEGEWQAVGSLRRR